jgi:hypothetical protein
MSVIGMMSKCCNGDYQSDDEGRHICLECGDFCELEEIKAMPTKSEIAYERSMQRARARGVD